MGVAGAEDVEVCPVGAEVGMGAGVVGAVEPLFGSAVMGAAPGIPGAVGADTAVAIDYIYSVLAVTSETPVAPLPPFVPVPVVPFEPAV